MFSKDFWCINNDGNFEQTLPRYDILGEILHCQDCLAYVIYDAEGNTLVDGDAGDALGALKEMNKYVAMDISDDIYWECNKSDNSLIAEKKSGMAHIKFNIEGERFACTLTPSKFGVNGGVIYDTEKSNVVYYDTVEKCKLAAKIFFGESNE